MARRGGRLLVYQVEHVTKRYGNGKLANDDICLGVRRGEILGLFGPNGAGKSTLVKQMVGLIRPTAGKIRLLGTDIHRDTQAIPRLVAYLGQTDTAFSSFSFRELIIHAGVHRGLSRRDAYREADELIEYFDCGRVASTLRFRLSGGERRLSLLLATFIARREILILDEPTNELDPTNRAAIWRYVSGLCKINGTTVVLVTHNVFEADTVVDRVAIVDSARLSTLGTPGELKAALGDTARVEISIKAGCEAYLPPDAEHLHGQRWRLMVPRSQAMDLFSEIVAATGQEAIDDFRISTISLEDVYVQVTKRADREGAIQRAAAVQASD